MSRNFEEYDEYLDTLLKENVICRENLLETNKVYICGIVEEKPEYDHEVCGERFYRTNISVTRTSGTVDYIPVIVSEKLKDIPKDTMVKVTGQFRSVREKDDKVRHLKLYLFATEVHILEREEFLEENIVFLEGIIAKKPYFKIKDTRRITDLCIIVKRKREEYRADYIPCVAWGKDADYTKNLKKGDRIKLYGRIQSRNKKKDNHLVEEKVYEVSILTFEVVED